MTEPTYICRLHRTRLPACSLHCCNDAYGVFSYAESKTILVKCIRKDFRSGEVYAGASNDGGFVPRRPHCLHENFERRFRCYQYTKNKQQACQTVFTTREALLKKERRNKFGVILFNIIFAFFLIVSGLRTFSWRLSERFLVCSVLRSVRGRWSYTSQRR